jgi:hypothetical protein
MLKKLGYFVEGKPFQGRKAQAVAYASRLADEYRRPVQVLFTGDDGTKVVGVADPQSDEPEVIEFVFEATEEAA